ncbi:uncharacterized protein SCHCODRAFT_02685792 [Schizophyllum commune H4-8]|uniref:uncharacterized protein n=1 Tax=Schizophyllum commune (strain H4-8 / FGSC 9210) TaxID=578458 RepID=UPI002160BA4B|nr:uncharacterized protein SCHCODRAFT_02685792 [Schizophyllum commune H4-8]KAI5896880.1 hypothetical protein SCHCODRAFT_02685792 [Schizophyllum commune H4-8]
MDHASGRPFAAGCRAAPHLAQEKPRHLPCEEASAVHLAHPRSPRHPLHRSPRSEVEEAEEASAYAEHRHAAEAATSDVRAEAEGHVPPQQTEEVQAVQGQRPSARTALTPDERGAAGVAEAFLPFPTLRSVPAKPNEAAVELIDEPEEVEVLPLPQVLAKATLAEEVWNVEQEVLVPPHHHPLAAVATAPVSQGAAASSSALAARATAPP